MNIKAIDTFYNGYKFRSRLEAKWAVFFDNANIEYEYEPEGFRKKRICYLPDFYLPKFDMYVEVKPPRDGFEREIKKAWDLIVWGGEIRKLLILSNIPPHGDKGQWCFPIIYYGFDGVQSGWWTFHDIWGDEFYNDDDSPISIGVDGYLYQFNSDCTQPIGIDKNGNFYCSVDATSDIELNKTSYTAMMLRKHSECDNLDELEKWVPHIESPMLFNALDKARQARFEYGEKG